jgi:hypothetical protein
MSGWYWTRCAWGGHDDRLRERDAQGCLVLVCPTCGDRVTPLADLQNAAIAARAGAAKARELVTLVEARS